MEIEGNRFERPDSHGRRYRPRGASEPNIRWWADILRGYPPLISPSKKRRSARISASFRFFRSHQDSETGDGPNPGAKSASILHGSLAGLPSSSLCFANLRIKGRSFGPSSTVRHHAGKKKAPEKPGQRGVATLVKRYRKLGSG